MLIVMEIDDLIGKKMILSEHLDSEALPSKNAQLEPFILKFGDRDGRLPQYQNEEPPTPHVNPSDEEIQQCIDNNDQEARFW